MSNKKAVDALVLREVPVGDSDKLLTVLTAEYGKLYVTAKGARSAKSKVMALCRIFTYANIEFYEKGDRRWLSGGSVNDSFFGINSDLAGFSLASYILQIADEITGEGVEAHDVLRMTLNSLYCIEKKVKPLWQIKAVYELFAVTVSGMEPDLSACAVCKTTEASGYWLDVMNGRIICEDCMRRASGNAPLAQTDQYNTRNILIPMDRSSIASAAYVIFADPQRIFSFSLKEGDSRENFCRAAEVYLINHLERSFDALDFYKSLKEDI